MDLDLELMEDIKDGATIWSPIDAKKIRELQKEHPDWVDIIDNMKKLECILGKKFDGAKKVPYFGAILTAEGKAALKIFDNQNGIG